MRNFGMYSNEIMKKLKNSDEEAVFYAFSFWIYRGINFCGCKKRIYDRILERCIPVKIDGVSRREAMANDNMQIMKNILKI